MKLRLKGVGHMCTSVLIEVDGNKATGECYGIAVGSQKSDDGTLVDSMYGGRYLDEFERREGEWRISKLDIYPRLGKKISQRA